MVKKGQTSQVMEYLNINHCSTIQNNQKMTLLQQACKNKNYDLFRYLIKLGTIDTNYVDQTGATALSYAIKGNDMKTAELLLQNGASVTKCFIDGSSAREYVVKHVGVKRALQKLIQEANSDQLEKEMGRVQVESKAENAGPIVTGHVASKRARDNPNIDHEYVISENLPPNFDIFASIENGDNYPVLGYMSQGGDLEYRDDRDTNLLQHAARCNNFCIAKTLLDRAVDPNHIDEHGFTALAYAVYQQCAPIAEVLLEYGASIDKSMVAGMPLLNFAKTQPDQKMQEIIQSSIQKKYVITQQLKNLEEGLTTNIQNQYVTILEQSFQNHSQDPHIQNQHEQQPNVNGHSTKLSKNAKQRLNGKKQRKNPEPLGDVFEAMETGNMKDVQRYVSFKQEPNILNGNNSNLLQAAIQCNRKEVILLLLKYGTDVYHVDKSGSDTIGILIGDKRNDLLSIVLRVQGLDLQRSIYKGQPAFDMLKNSTNEIDTKIYRNLQRYVKQQQTII